MAVTGTTNRKQGPKTRLGLRPRKDACGGGGRDVNVDALIRSLG